MGTWGGGVPTCHSLNDIVIEPVSRILDMPSEKKHCIIREAHKNKRSGQETAVNTVYMPLSSTKLVGVVGIDVQEKDSSNKSAQHLTDRSCFDSLLRQYLSNLGTSCITSLMTRYHCTGVPPVQKSFSFNLELTS